MSRPAFTLRWSEPNQCFELTIVEGERIVPPYELPATLTLSDAYQFACGVWKGQTREEAMAAVRAPR